LGPKSKKTWQCLLAVDFPVTLNAETSGGPVERQFGLVVRRGSTVVHQTTRKVSIGVRNARLSSRHVAFDQSLELEPGKYIVTVVLGGAESAKPYTAVSTVVVPPVPKGEIFLTAPVLGKQANQDVVIHAEGGLSPETRPDEAAKSDRVGSSRSFMPLLVQRIESSDQLFALTEACLVKKGHAERKAVVQRELDFEDGGRAGTLPSSTIAFDGKNRIDCQSLIDILPSASLPPGDYVFTAALAGEAELPVQPQAAHFSVAGTLKTSPAPH